ncbi:ROK family protein [Deinococcus alpinitundrae]|uniref:ROK family protein n=1 Tax=Deinococcus alpinitundrae TaxID=468913 RepID=UPI0013793CEB|nr:ROK family protein [Deinococcus alpinitundrae]
MTSSKGDPSSLRVHNRRTILNHIRQQGPISRTQLVELTGLSSASVTGITSELIDDRLLTEKSIGEAGLLGGRRPIYLDIDWDVHYAVGIKLREDRIEAVLTDLSTRVLAHLSENLVGQAPEQVVSQIKDICKKLYRRAKIKKQEVIGIGICLSGVIDARNGTAVSAYLLGWHGVPMSDMVTRATGLPTWIDNDLNAFAAAERLFGHGKHARNFIVIAIGRGVGAAFIANGEIVRGRDGGAGEFGHNLIVPGGRVCGCGRRGCLEAYTAEGAILAQFVERFPERAGISVSKLVALADDGHEGARGLLQETGELIGLHLSYLVNAFNPELIVTGGEGSRLGRWFFDSLRRSLHEAAFDGLATELPIIVVPWQNDDFTPWAQGAASLAVQSAFETGAILKMPVGTDVS